LRWLANLGRHSNDRSVDRTGAALAQRDHELTWMQDANFLCPASLFFDHVWSRPASDAYLCR
jgi:hypothetical protein